MKAVGFTEFGGPEVVRVMELPEPQAGPRHCTATCDGAANARRPDVLAAQRREHARIRIRIRIRSEKGIRWGGNPLTPVAA